MFQQFFNLCLRWYSQYKSRLCSTPNKCSITNVAAKYCENGNNMTKKNTKLIHMVATPTHV